MKTTLTIQEKLKDLRTEHNLTLEELSEKTDISRAALGKYESDDLKDISPFNLAKLAKFYDVSTDYLMGLSEQRNHPNTPIETLHISDEMISLLQSGELNNRLLSEIVTHKGFPAFMIDLEVYINKSRACHGCIFVIYVIDMIYYYRHFFRASTSSFLVRIASGSGTPLCLSSCARSVT